MTLKELKEKLNNIPNYYDDLKVVYYDEFHFGIDSIEDVEISNDNIKLTNRNYEDEIRL